jgi:hypothetical protein
MRKMPFQIGSGLEINRQQDPWRRRMPAQIYIGPDLPKRSFPAAQPATFGKRRVQPDSVMRPRRFSLVRLASSLFQAPRKTRRTNAR